MNIQDHVKTVWVVIEESEGPIFSLVCESENEAVQAAKSSAEQTGRRSWAAQYEIVENTISEFKRS